MKSKALIVAVASLCMMGVRAASAKTQHIYHVGNSLTDNIYFGGIKDIATANGNTYAYGKTMSPGAPLDYLWSGNTKDGSSIYSVAPYGTYKNALTKYTWDDLTLEPFDNQITGSTGDLQTSENFINLAVKKSPNVQTYIYERWPERPTDSKGNFTSFNYDQAYMKAYTGSVNRWDQADTRQGYFLSLTKDINKAETKLKKQVAIVPVGDVFDVLDKDIKAGKLKGYSNITQFYADGLHMNEHGAYIIAATFYATMFDKNLTGQSIPGAYGKWDPTTAKEVQQAVWSVVSTEKYDGIGGINGKSFSSSAKSALATAEALGTMVPEPMTVGLLALAPLALRRRRV